MTLSIKCGVKASPAFRRVPNVLQSWVRRAEQDFALLGQVERILDRDAEMMGSMVRTSPDEYLILAPNLAALVARHVEIVDAATEAHEAVVVALKGIENQN